MLVLTNELGQSLAQALGKGSVVLMRGHGNAVAGPDLKTAVFRAIYTEVNAKLQMQAVMLGGPINFLNEFETAQVRRTSTDPGPRGKNRRRAVTGRQRHAAYPDGISQRFLRFRRATCLYRQRKGRCGGRLLPRQDRARDIGYGAGGNYDLYGRVATEFLSRHIPGNPT